jgi:dienelactone hydrolase
MGGSHGGSTTLATMVAWGAAQRDPGFTAGIALYPGCNARYGDWRPGGTGAYRPIAPLLILSGGLDDWTPAEPCRQLAERSRAAGYPVTVKIYPDAHHSFDSDRPVRYDENRINGNARTGRGATTGGNPEAWADSIKQVTAFFAERLK